MPTINIPDKICSHCGGTKWFTKVDRYLKKNGELRESISYSCAKLKEERTKLWNSKNRDKRNSIYKRCKEKVKDTKEYKEKNKARSRAWRLMYPEKKNDYNTVYRQKYRDRYNSWCKKAKINSRVNLTDSYLKSLIIHDSILSCLDVPQDLIELKRKQLLLKRKIKSNGKD